MQHVRCKKCKAGISKVQSQSHNGFCGECYVITAIPQMSKAKNLFSDLFARIKGRRTSR